MSTVFYGYRVAKADFWSLAMQVRDFYRKELLDQMLRPVDVMAQEAVADPAVYESLQKDFLDSSRPKKLAEVFGCTLQLFDIGDHYYFRPREASWFFHNEAKRQGWAVEPFTVDTRTECDAAEEERLRFALDVIDPMISAGRFLCFSVLEAKDFELALFNWHLEVMKRVGEIKRSTEDLEQ